MIPPPPTSTLFPYTTLFRSGHLDLQVQDAVELSLELTHQDIQRFGLRNRARKAVDDEPRGAVGLAQAVADHADHRSEEHTSELQSRRDLVCRLLLEKKKKMK